MSLPTTFTPIKTTPVFFINIKVGVVEPVSNPANSPKSLLFITIVDGQITPINNDKGLSINVDGIHGTDKITVNTNHSTRQLDCDLFGKTPNGSTVKIYYPGLMQQTEKLLNFDSGKSDVADFNDYIHFNYPTFELGDGVEPEYNWLAENNFIGQGRFIKENGAAYVQYIVSLIEN